MGVEFGLRCCEVVTCSYSKTPGIRAKLTNQFLRLARWSGDVEKISFFLHYNAISIKKNFSKALKHSFYFQGPCCTNKCSLKIGDLCRNDNGCRDASYCNGLTPSCPASINKPNKTVCNEEFVCYMGVSTLNIRELVHECHQCHFWWSFLANDLQGLYLGPKASVLNRWLHSSLIVQNKFCSVNYVYNTQ